MHILCHSRPEQSLTVHHSLSGEATKLVIDNYLRSLTYGSKYVFQTLPKLLTLWLEHASIVDQPIDPKRGDNE
jgi:serine/threonine-protein kinase ATR